MLEVNSLGRVSVDYMDLANSSLANQFLVSNQIILCEPVMQNSFFWLVIKLCRFLGIIRNS